MEPSEEEHDQGGGQPSGQERSKQPEPGAPAKRDPAAAIGRISGRAFAGVVRRALRVPAVAEAVRRAREEASR